MCGSSHYPEERLRGQSVPFPRKSNCTPEAGDYFRGAVQMYWDDVNRGLLHNDFATVDDVDTLDEVCNLGGGSIAENACTGDCEDSHCLVACDAVNADRCLVDSVEEFLLSRFEDRAVDGTLV